VLFRSQKLLEDPLRIFGGSQTDPGEFPDCVAVGSSSNWCCTGTLIGRNVVVTAGHCEATCASRIFIGTNVDSAGRVIKVKQAIRHPDYSQAGNRNDLTVLILAEDVKDVTPRPIAASADIDAASFVRLVGYGFTEFGDFGVQNKVDVFIGSASCDTSQAQSKFGCNADKELVAGGNGHDSCNGDSGGPAYVVVGDKTYVAGATSRATRNSLHNCGDGGIYVRLDRYMDWITQTVRDNGGHLP